MDIEIIDFHTHPFLTKDENICQYKDIFDITAEESMNYLKNIGISKICGSVLNTDGKKGWGQIKKRNEKMLHLKEIYADFYIPGFHVHPSYVKESLNEIEKMNNLGVKLIGELVPYWDGWKNYSDKNFFEILELADNYNMVVSVHTMDEDGMNKMLKRFKNVTFVGAHPGEYNTFMGHIERLKNDNYYLDISGSGIVRQGLLKYGINKVGKEKFIFGSDYPICNPAMFIGAILLDSTIKGSEKEAIFSKNVKRILNLKK